MCSDFLAENTSRAAALKTDCSQYWILILNLVGKMSEVMPQNVKLQISLENSVNGRTNQTKLSNKADIILKLTDWVILFIDYHDMKIKTLHLNYLKSRFLQAPEKELTELYQ